MPLCNTWFQFQKTSADLKVTDMESAATIEGNVTEHPTAMEGKTVCSSCGFNRHLHFLFLPGLVGGWANGCMDLRFGAKVC